MEEQEEMSISTEGLLILMEELQDKPMEQQTEVLPLNNNLNTLSSNKLQ